MILLVLTTNIHIFVSVHEYETEWKVLTVGSEDVNINSICKIAICWKCTKKITFCCTSNLYTL